MGLVQVNAACVVNGAPLAMDTMPIQHQVNTASLSHAVTDSAAAGTSLATGYRTNNGMVAMSPSGERLTSILKLAQAAGKGVGVVVTDEVFGATPGAFLANVPNRSDYTDILEQAIFETKPDVLLGGGANLFVQIQGEERLEPTECKLVRTRQQLLAWDTAIPIRLVGLFAPTTMTYEVERTLLEPSIAEMTQVALDVLSQNEKGFFLMIEGSRIDHAGHANDLRRNVNETLAFDQAVAVALAFAEERNDTVVIVTADHETGGLTIGTGPSFSPKVMNEGVSSIAKKIADAIMATPEADLKLLFEEHAGITELTESVVHQGTLLELITEILKEYSFYFTTGGHTAASVPLRVFGPGSERFKDAEHISDIGRTAIELMGLQTGGAQ